MSAGKVIYKYVVGYPRYLVGSDGKVWSRRRGVWTQLKYKIDKFGYHRVTLNGDCYLVHRLVLEAFIGKCPPGMQCRHDPDPDKSNNNLLNLQWGTAKENAQDRIRHGSQVKGERMWKAKMTEHMVHQIRADYKTKKNFSELGRKYNVRHSTIERIVRRKTWKHVS